MKLLWLYLGAFLILPIVGEYVVMYADVSLSAGQSSWGLIIRNIIFVLILLGIAYMIQSYKMKNLQIVEIFDYGYAKRIFSHSFFILLIASTIIFALSGYKVLLGLSDRGEIRSTLGAFGPLFTLALSYIPVAIFVYVSVVYIHLNKRVQKLFRKKLMVIYFFAILLGVFSGYKSVAITLMIPGLVVLYLYDFNIWRMLVTAILGIVALTLFTTLVRGESVNQSFFFMIHRSTVMTAFGTIGVWNEFPNGVASIGDVFINFLGAFGQKISSVLLGISPHDPEFLKTNLSRLITYKVYPDMDRALSGAVNVTVTNFGHALYLFGKDLYVFYAIIVGVIVGVTIRLYKKFIIFGYPLKASLVALFFFSAIIPSINSGGIFVLFSIPVWVYMFLVYLIMKYTIKGNIIV